MARLVVATALFAAACHTTTRIEDSHTLHTSLKPKPGSERERGLTLEITDDARFRFVHPLVCQSIETLDQEVIAHVEVKPNLATVVVGAVLTGVGLVAAVRGGSDDDPLGNPFTYVAAPVLGTGLVLDIGPWLGIGEDDIPGATRQLDRAGPETPCGAHPVSGTHATVTANGMTIYGAVDSDGYFQVSPFSVVDAYNPGSAAGWDVKGSLDTAAGTQTFTTIIQADAFTKVAAAFFARARFDYDIAPMRLVPGLSAAPLRVSLVSVGGEQAIHIVTPISNEGPGDAYAVRGVTLSNLGELDGRFGYVGAIPKNESRPLELFIPLSAEAVGKLHGAISIAVQLADGHGTAPSTPIRYSGPLLQELPR